MKKKPPLSKNYLERIPKRSAALTWKADDNGIVTLEIQHVLHYRKSRVTVSVTFCQAIYSRFYSEISFWFILFFNIWNIFHKKAIVGSHEFTVNQFVHI